MSRNIKKIIQLISLFVAGVCSFTLFSMTGFFKRAVIGQDGENTYILSDSTVSVTYGEKDTRGVAGAKVTLTNFPDKNKVSFDYGNYLKKDNLADGFLEISFSPDSPNVQEFDYLFVTLTDAADDSQKLVWAVAPQPEICGWWNSWTAAWVSYTDMLEPWTSVKYTYNAGLKVSGTDQHIMGRNNSFIAPTHQYYTGPYMEVGFNLGKKAVYFVPQESGAIMNSLTFKLSNSLAQINGNTIADLTDTDYLTESGKQLINTPYEELYKEETFTKLFSSGFCKLSVQFVGVNSESISCHIKKIGNQILGENEIINASPFITIKKDTEAVLGYDYKLPDVKILDMREGDISNRVRYSVIDAEGNDVAINSGEVLFNSEGVYEMEISVSLEDGTTFSEKSDIVCYADMPITDFHISASFEDEYKTGDTVPIPYVFAENNLSTQIDGRVDVICVIQNNGSTQSVFDSDKTNYYTLKEAGDYTVAYLFRNAYGIVNSTTYNFLVSESIGISPEYLPVSFTSGAKCSVADFEPVDYVNATSANEIYRAIYINGEQIYVAKGETVISGSLSFVKNISEISAELTYKAGFDINNLIYEKTFIIPVIQTNYADDYIILSQNGVYNRDGIETVNSRTELIFSVSDDTVFTLPQRLFADELKFSFDVKSEYNQFGYLSVILRDFKDANKNIQLSIYKNNEISSLLYINGVYSGEIDGSFVNDSNYFEWRFDSKKNIFVNNFDRAITSKIKRWSDGTEFNGFTDGSCVLSFEMKDVQGTSRFALKKVNNQPFYITEINGRKQRFNDIYAPIIKVSEVINTELSYGERINIPKAEALDVLSANTLLEVSVSSPSGETLYTGNAKDNVMLFANQYGNWTIKYMSHDGNDLFSVEDIYILKVDDVIPPAIYVSETLPTKLSVNSELIMPIATVFDNRTQNCKYYIIVISPNGKRVVCSDRKYKFTSKGVYIISYYTFDDYMNVALVNYEIEIL